MHMHALRLTLSIKIGLSVKKKIKTGLIKHHRNRDVNESRTTLAE